MTVRGGEEAQRATIRALRREIGWSAAEVARLAGRSAWWIYQQEQGTRPVSAAYLSWLADLAERVRRLRGEVRTIPQRDKGG